MIRISLPISIGLISGALEPNQWKDQNVWRTALTTHRVIVSTPQVLLDAPRHGYVSLREDISLLVFDEAHHAADKHPYNVIMREFHDHYSGSLNANNESIKPSILGLTASPFFGGNVSVSFK